MARQSKNKFFEYRDGLKTCVVMDEPFRATEVSREVSELRRRRWALLAHRNAIVVGEWLDRDGEIYRVDREIDKVRMRLYELTLNPVYQ